MERPHLWRKKLACVLTTPLAIFAIALPSSAQDVTPKTEVYGGYSYVRVSDLGDSYNFNGGSGQFGTMPTAGWGSSETSEATTPAMASTLASSPTWPGRESIFADMAS